MKLNQVSTYERGVSTKEYPKSSLLCQISATKGQLKLIEEADVVDSKYLVITPNDKVIPKYLYYAMEANIERFVYRYRTGLNLTPEAFQYFDIVVYNLKTQAIIVRLLDYLSELLELEERLLELWKMVKEYMLDAMFV